MGFEPIMVQEFLKNSWANLEDQEEVHDKEGFQNGHIKEKNQILNF